MNPATLHYLAATIEHKYNDKPFEEAVILKAAFLVDIIGNKGHVFIEGNKRTAMASMKAFLGINKIELDTSDHVGTFEFILKVAQGKLSSSAIARWIRERIKTRH